MRPSRNCGLYGANAVSSKITQVLQEILPGETRILTRRSEPQLSRNRWLEVIPSGHVSPGLFIWVNRPDPLPHPESFRHKGRSLLSVPKPIFQFSGKPDELGDFYWWSDLFCVSRRVLDVIRRIDPHAVEFVEGESEAGQFFLCLPRHVLDVIDDEVSDITISYLPLFSGSQTFRKTVRFASKKYAFKQDIDRSIHCVMPLYYSRFYWSRALVDAVVAVGARHIRFSPPFCDREDQMIRV
jgi:hypothetical protein